MPLFLTLWALGGAALVAQGVPSSGSGLTRLPTLVSIEHLPLGPSTRALALVVEPLAQRIELRTVGAAGLAARLAAITGDICPLVETRPGVVVLRCRTRRLDAELIESGGTRTLEIRELRGLPWRGADQVLELSYVPLVVHAGGACPGTSAIERGECAYAEHAYTEAWLQFRLALETRDRAWAALRLGDLALRARDVGHALSFYLDAGHAGMFGRMAFARLCELTGSCLEDPTAAAFDGAGMPEPLASELRLRRARADAFAGRIAPVVNALDATLAGADGGIGLCDRVGQRFCRRLVMEALAHAEGDVGRRALSVYLATPRRTEGALAVEMARAAAERAAALGAPIFGANILASVFRSVPSEDMDDYLGRTAELYLRGRDFARAGVMVDYADTRLAPRQLAVTRWRAIRAALHEDGAAEERDAEAAAGEARFEELATVVARDVAAAFGILARARAAQQ